MCQYLALLLPIDSTKILLKSQSNDTRVLIGQHIKELQVVLQASTLLQRQQNDQQWRIMTGTGVAYVQEYLGLQIRQIS